jgi:hypothetical protein
MNHFCRIEELINVWEEDSALDNNKDSTTDVRVVERNSHKYVDKIYGYKISDSMDIVIQNGPNFQRNTKVKRGV